MFYKQDDIDNNLKCPQCQVRYVDAKIVPCSGTICASCIENSTTDNHFDCFLCHNKHKIPDEGGFLSNNIVMQLINVKADHVYHNPLVRKLNEINAQLDELVNKTNETKQNPESAILNHCASIRHQIDLAVEKKIDEIKKTHEKFIKQVNDYQDECLANLNKHIFRNKFSIDDVENHIKESYNYVKNFKIDEQELKSKLEKSKAKIRHVKILLNEIESIQFNKKMLQFEDKNTFNDDFVGTLNTTQIKDIKSEDTFKLVINNLTKFSKNEESLSSSEFIVHKIPWKINAVSKKSINDSKQLSLGVFVQCFPKTDFKCWTVYASVEIRLLHATDPQKNLVKNFDHLFDGNGSGFPEFITMSDIMDEKKGYYNVDEDLATVEVCLITDGLQETK